VEKVITELESRASAADTTIDEKVQAVQGEFDKHQEQIKELDDDLTEVKKASAEVSTQQQAAFTTAETDRSTTFNKLVRDQQKELEVSLEDIEADAKKSVEYIKAKVKADEDEAATARQRIEEILGIVGEEALIGDYSKNALGESKAADIWRYITAGSIVGAIITAICFASGINDYTSWQHFASKTIIVLSFGGLAGYAAKQSSEHRAAQRNAERMALQLKALKPYLNDLQDNNKRDELLAKIADRLFGQEQPLPLPKGKNNDNPLLTSQLIDAILELIKRDKM